MSKVPATKEKNDAHSLKTKVGLLEKDLERRQESYIARERAYKSRIEELEGEVMNIHDNKTGWMKADAKMLKLKKMQQAIMTNVELVQDRTSRILQEQERDLLRAFRARLYDVQTELEREKSKKDDGAGAWMERAKQLSSELEWAKEVADRLERVNSALSQENKRLKSQFKSQEEDRDFLIKQLVGVKKDNARLRTEFAATDKENERLAEDLRKSLEGGGGRASPMPGARGLDKGGAGGESDEKLRDVNKRLRRLLADERRSLQQVRSNYASELKARTELEMLLRQCVEDVRKEIARRHVDQAKFTNNVAAQDLANLYAKNPDEIPLEDFTQEDRERSMELLLSQERVVTLLYAKTFPIAGKQSGTSLEGGAENVDGITGIDEDGRPMTTGASGDKDKLPGIRPGAKSNLE
jgi:hypothetical protein